MTDDFGEAPELNWSGHFGGSAFDRAADIISDDAGNIIIAGSFSGVMGDGSNSWTSVGTSDAFVAKFDDAGDLIWLTQLSPSEGETTEVEAVCLDNEGLIYVTGTFTGDVQFGTDSLSQLGTQGLFYAKLNISGEVLMASNHESPNDAQIPKRINADQEGNIYILGYALDENMNIHHSIILKFNSSGILAWEQEHDEIFNGLAVKDSSIYMSGEYYPSHDGILDEDVVLETFSNTKAKAFVVQADLTGDFHWASAPDHLELQFGRSSGQDVGVDESGNIYLAGYFYNHVVFGSDTLYSNTSLWQGFIAKYNSSGVFVWTTRLMEGQYVNLLISEDGISYVWIPGVISKVDLDGDILWTEPITPEPSAITLNPSGKLLVAGTEKGLIFISQLNHMTSTDWILQLKGNSGTGSVLGIVSDYHGNLYTCGYVSNTADFFGEKLSNGIFICKQNGSGKVLWLHQYPGRPLELDTHMEALYIDTVNHTLIVSGMLADTIEIPPHTLHVPEGKSSMLVIKIDLQGNYICSFQEDFDSDFSLKGIITDHSGNIVMSGLFEDTIIIGDQHLVPVVPGGEGADACIVKYDPNGDLLWAIAAGGEDMEYTAITSADTSDNIFLAGESVSSSVMVNQTDLEMEEGKGNILFAKLNQDGEVLWVKTIAATGHENKDDFCWPLSIKVSKDGFVYIKGSMSDTAYFDEILLTSPYEGFNTFIVKTDNDGRVIWADILRQHHPRYSQDSHRLDIDSKGNVYFGGQVKDTLDFGDEFQYIPSSTYDLYVVRYSSDGQLDWVKGIRGKESSYYTRIRSIAAYDTGNVFVGADLNGYFTIDKVDVKLPNTHGFITMLGPDISGTNFYEMFKAYDMLLEVYPNPFNDFLQIEYKIAESSKVLLCVYDVLGNEVEILSDQILDTDIHSVQWNTGNILEGTYFLKLTTGSGSMMKKVVKIK